MRDNGAQLAVELRIVEEEKEQIITRKRYDELKEELDSAIKRPFENFTRLVGAVFKRAYGLVDKFEQSLRPNERNQYATKINSLRTLIKTREWRYSQ